MNTMNVPRKKYRVKSRSRFIISSIVTVLLLIMLSTTILGSNTVTSLTEQQYKQVEVQDGDTLWNIALKHMPSDMDPRKSVHILSDVNDTTADQIQPGQIINIPIEK